jgi:hypothetical protein
MDFQAGSSWVDRWQTGVQERQLPADRFGVECRVEACVPSSKQMLSEPLRAGMMRFVAATAIADALRVLHGQSANPSQ